MQYTTINIEGNLISEEILQKIDNSETVGQLATDFGFGKGGNLRNEIEYAWSRVKLDWKHFSERAKNLPVDDQYGTGLSRRWMEQFFSSLGFTLTLHRRSLVADNNINYVISHTVDNLDEMPIHIVGFNDPNRPDKNTLDIRSSGGTSRMSPHATVQEYVNATEHLFGITTNGMFLRLVRDSGRLIRLSYLEFDIKRMLDEDKYSEFTLLYRLLHASRFPKRKDVADESIFERYYQDSIESGNRIREGLSEAVKQTLVTLGNGLLQHPENDRLRAAYENGSLTADIFNHQLLRFIYRLLFLIVTEDRDLIFENGLDDPNKARNKEIYYKYYSIERLRKLSTNRFLFEHQYTDLWQSLMQTFSLFEPGHKGKPLGVFPLGGDLFSGGAIHHLQYCKLSNHILLESIRNLNEFADDKGNRMYVNYRSLDVEELGSVYEGLLELAPIIKPNGHTLQFLYEQGSERDFSGSHYTPEDLVKPLIEHSLDYQIEERVRPFYKGEADKETTVQKLLALKVCDISCGSGHILLSAARRIAHEVARIETGEQQPNPQSFRRAIKDVIRHCIYGVDKNPLAVELCKVALWLESHNPGEPLNFLDHHIKCGDAIVGLAHRSELENGIPSEAFKALSGDDRKVANAFRRKNNDELKLRKAKEVQLKVEFDEVTASSVQEAMEEYRLFNQMPENNPEQIAKKAKAYNKFLDGKGYSFLKLMADTQLAQFFIPKTEKNKEYLMTDAQFRLMVEGRDGYQNKQTSKAMVISNEERFFHWFLEFPEVFSQGGFDCILGNPPFLGGQRISGAYGHAFLESIKYQFAPIGAVDMVTYFFRRAFTLIKPNGFQSLISTNTIAQGRAREDGLDIITQQGGTINHAVKNMKWPGEAAVEVSLVTITKQDWKNNFVLDGKIVPFINPYLDDAEVYGNPYQLKVNDGKSFQGTIVLGLGFTLEPSKAKELISKDPKNKDVLFPYLGGYDLNNDPSQTPSRWVINFFDWSEEKAKTYPDCYSILEEHVKEERLKTKGDRGAKYWWQFLRMRKELYDTVALLSRFLVSCRVSKYVNHSFVTEDTVIDVGNSVVARETFWEYSFLQSSIHNHWAWNYASTMKFDIRYTNKDCIDTFPFPINMTGDILHNLEDVGKAYYEYRKQLMLDIQLGLTRTYNAFHCQEINIDNEKWSILFEELDSGKSLSEIKLKPYDFERESTNLIRHFLKDEATISLKEAVIRIEKLRKLHTEMDLAVLEAYGWHVDNGDKKAIDLKHDFYEVDYLPENDRIRYTIHPDARKEVLQRLLLLNFERYDEEVEAGLWDKKKPKKRRNYKTKNKTKGVSEPKPGYGTLFE